MTFRIAVVAPYDLSASGGINTQIRAQAGALRHLGHTVDVFGPASSSLTDGEGALGRSVAISLGGTETGLGVDPRAIAAVNRMARVRFDVIHVHEPLTPLVPWIVVALARAPLVGTFHVHREEGHRLYARWQRALQPIMRRFAARIAVSDAARRTVARYFPGEYEIVPNGVDIAAFCRPRPRRVRDGRPRVLYVGRLEPRKGVEYLVRAMASVRRRVPDALLVVAGDGAERESLSQLARTVDATGDGVQFVGRVAEADLPDYFESADIVCSPAVGGESFGVVLLEAMAWGKPIVATRIDGYRGLVGSAACARLVAPRDAEGLAGEIIALLESDQTRRQMGRAGRILAANYDWPVIARRLEETYRRVVNAARNDGDHTRSRSTK